MSDYPFTKMRIKLFSKDKPINAFPKRNLININSIKKDNNIPKSTQLKKINNLHLSHYKNSDKVPINSLPKINEDYNNKKIIKTEIGNYKRTISPSPNCRKVSDNWKINTIYPYKIIRTKTPIDKRPSDSFNNVNSKNLSNGSSIKNFKGPKFFTDKNENTKENNLYSDKQIKRIDYETEANGLPKQLHIVYSMKNKINDLNQIIELKNKEIERLNKFISGIENNIQNNSKLLDDYNKLLEDYESLLKENDSLKNQLNTEIPNITINNNFLLSDFKISNNYLTILKDNRFNFKDKYQNEVKLNKELDNKINELNDLKQKELLELNRKCKQQENIITQMQDEINNLNNKQIQIPTNNWQILLIYSKNIDFQITGIKKEDNLKIKNNDDIFDDKQIYVCRQVATYDLRVKLKDNNKPKENNNSINNHNNSTTENKSIPKQPNIINQEINIELIKEVKKINFEIINEMAFNLSNIKNEQSHDEIKLDTHSLLELPLLENMITKDYPLIYTNTYEIFFDLYNGRNNFQLKDKNELEETKDNAIEPVNKIITLSEVKNDTFSLSVIKPQDTKQNVPKEETNNNVPQKIIEPTIKIIDSNLLNDFIDHVFNLTKDKYTRKEKFILNLKQNNSN